jgi:adenylate cyclase
VFSDLSGYTQLTEERGDAAAAEIATRLGELVRRSAHDHGGRPVKWLGDGVMVHFEDPGAAVISALEMVDRILASGLPPAHAGIAAGPVIFQDGDYFGRTVNTAARIASHASAGQVLVTDDVLRTANDPGIRFTEIGLVELRGLPLPIRLHRAHGSGSVQSNPEDRRKRLKDG